MQHCHFANLTELTFYLVNVSLSLSAMPKLQRLTFERCEHIQVPETTSSAGQDFKYLKCSGISNAASLLAIHRLLTSSPHVALHNCDLQYYGMDLPQHTDLLWRIPFSQHRSLQILQFEFMDPPDDHENLKHQLWDDLDSMPIALRFLRTFQSLTLFVPTTVCKRLRLHHLIIKGDYAIENIPKDAVQQLESLFTHPTRVSWIASAVVNSCHARPDYKDCL